jgi:cob(I)alamin adenosyltransferase
VRAIAPESAWKSPGVWNWASVQEAGSRQAVGCEFLIIVRVKIYTRTGDTGDTALFDGTRVPKSNARVAAYGDVDELNAWLGLVRALVGDAELGARIEQIQRDLFAVGARLADPAHRIAERVRKAAIAPADVARLESWIDELES